MPDPEAGDEAAYPEDTTLSRYTQSGLQILGLVTAVHGTDTPKEPATVQQALGGEHKEKWRQAMDKELKALQERNTWKVVPIGVARNKTILTGKWVFRVKTKADGTIDKFKARWVVRGFDQEHGRDFTETFAPVSRHTSLRILLAVYAMKKKKLRQIDVANAFLYAPVDAKIYVELPHGSHGEPNQVCQLQKSLYGIKQAPRLWQQYLHARLTRIGFKQLPHDQGMYRFTKDDDYILLIVYVDDLLYIGSTNNVTTWFEGELQKDLTLTVSSTVTQYLGLNIQEGEDAIHLNIAKYADTIAKQFALTPTTISTPYRYTAGNDKGESAPLKPADIRNHQRKLGCLLFAAVTCRPDLSYSASQLATYLKRPEDEHMKELDRALHYLDEIEKGRLELSYCPTFEMAADYLTKKLGKSKFGDCAWLQWRACRMLTALLLASPRAGSGLPAGARAGAGAAVKRQVRVGGGGRRAHCERERRIHAAAPFARHPTVPTTHCTLLAHPRPRAPLTHTHPRAAVTLTPPRGSEAYPEARSMGVVVASRRACAAGFRAGGRVGSALNSPSAPPPHDSSPPNSASLGWQQGRAGRAS
ncbi:unnamed protein product [Closterium sp. NIES-54]